MRKEGLVDECIDKSRSATTRGACRVSMVLIGRLYGMGRVKRSLSNWTARGPSSASTMDEIGECVPRFKQTYRQP